jgi:hypothetical protein
MRTQQELEKKLEELKTSLKDLQLKSEKKNLVEIDYLKYHINFIEWTLNMPLSYFKR